MNYFNLDEFKCPCCNVNLIDVQFVGMLDKAREKANTPFLISSGYRCKEHNKDVGGSATSSHLKGCAADIVCNNSFARKKIVESLLEVGFTRIGISDEFIHVDYDIDKPQDVVWTY
jgi:zinc D-Ala-D-Ala carboxypeptidase